MSKKFFTNNRHFLVIFAVLLFSSWNVQGQVKNEQRITCEYLKMIIDTSIVRSNNSIGTTESGQAPYTIFVVSPGDRKDSNVKIARRLIKRLDELFQTKEKYLRSVIIEGKQRKGYGHLQIYFVDELKDLAFSEDTLYCP